MKNKLQKLKVNQSSSRKNVSLTRNVCLADVFGGDFYMEGR